MTTHEKQNLSSNLFAVSLSIFGFVFKMALHANWHIHNLHRNTLVLQRRINNMECEKARRSKRWHSAVIIDMVFNNFTVVLQVYLFLYCYIFLLILTLWNIWCVHLYFRFPRCICSMIFSVCRIFTSMLFNAIDAAHIFFAHFAMCRYEIQF